MAEEDIWYLKPTNREASAKEQTKTPKSEKQPAELEGTKKVSDVLQSVHIALDSYDDIFSDFDPSPYETRILSDDFLNELKKHYIETPRGTFSIVFTLPHALRSDKKEVLIKKRIKDYFKSRLKEVDRTVKERLRRGGARVAVGLTLSLLVLVVPIMDHVLVAALLSPLLWYLMWSGFETVFEVSHKLRKRKSFLEKFLKSEYHFRDQEGVVGEVVQYSGTSYR